MTFAELSRLAKLAEGAGPNADIVKLAAEMAPTLTMYQTRAFPEERRIRGTSFEKHVAAWDQNADEEQDVSSPTWDGKKLALPRGFALGTNRRPTWRRVYALKEIRAKNRY